MRHAARCLVHVLAFTILCLNWSCSGANTGESMPVSLPVPFSGSYTGDNQIVIAEGTPVGGQISNQKLQSLGASPIAWQLFDTVGVPAGSLTLFRNTMSAPVVTPFSAGGERRSYTIKACVDLAFGGQTCASQLQCYEFPTDYTPSFDVSQVSPDDPGAVAVVRKAVCSGNNDNDGQLLDARFLMGMVQHSDGSLEFYSQEDSSIYLNQFGFNQSSGDPASRVVFTVPYQGGSVPLPIPLGSNALEVLATPLFLPGNDQSVGTEVDYMTLIDESEPELIRATYDADLFIGNSTLRIHNANAQLHHLPDVEPVVRQMVANRFADDPVVTPDMVQQGLVFFNTIAGTADPINCDPEANEANGLFRDLCDQYGSLTVELRCFILVDPIAGGVFNIQGSWLILRP